MGEELILLSLEHSPFVERVRIALAEKGITNYELREEDIFNKSPLLLKVNPVQKLVPVLIHNGKPICESMIIVQYIDEVWNDKAPLLPSHPYQRAHARFWADYIDKKIHLAGRKIWETKGEEREAAKEEFVQVFKTLEGELGDKPYFAGESFGFIDLAFIPFYSMFYSYEKLGNFSMEVVCPKILAWAKRCSQRETVSKSLLDQQKAYKGLLEFIKKKGFEFE